MYTSKNEYTKQEISNKRYFLSALEIVNNLEINNKKQLAQELQEKIELTKLNIEESEINFKNLTSKKEIILQTISKVEKINYIYQNNINFLKNSILIKRLNLIKIYKNLKATNFDDIFAKFDKERRNFDFTIFDFKLQNMYLNKSNMKYSKLLSEYYMLKENLKNKDIVYELNKQKCKDIKHIDNIKSTSDNASNDNITNDEQKTESNALIYENNLILDKINKKVLFLNCLKNNIFKHIKLLNKMTKLVAVKTRSKVSFINKDNGMEYSSQQEAKSDIGLNKLLSISFVNSFHLINKMSLSEINKTTSKINIYVL